MAEVVIGTAPIEPRIPGIQISEVSDAVGSSLSAVRERRTQVVGRMPPGVIGGHTQTAVVQVLSLQANVHGAVVRRSVTPARVDSRELVIDPREINAVERVVEISLSSAERVGSRDVVQ